MDVRPIRTREDYDAALDRIDALWGAAIGTPEGDELDVMVDLVAAHDVRHHRVPASECPPHEMIRAAMEERADGFADLARIVGSEAGARAVLAGAELSLPVIRRLNAEWLISAECLIREPGRRSAA